MKEVWNWIQLAIAGGGGVVGWYVGGIDGLIYTLVTFVVVDYVTGLLRAINEKKLSSKIGAKGITKKIMIFLLVGVAHMLDVEVIKGGNVLRDAVIFFYISNEGISLLENAVAIGLPVPEKLREILQQLHDKKGEQENGN
ncbi:holin family protein [Lactococcus lactis]|uniref:Toxin secretion/phage lysis holin n=1 Tax=Lactococcus lactis subsp. lactis A12 TaxID=1137134 RepID=S6EXY8_LACLL|nr:phage holin family protein [Lactococcus lactis]CDG04258.1 toxin secretion/phage lysis holin [Lactococcus lactis subsp. lactis A12]SBW30168.1 toxin secretion/phage lysis holin [Lactococcus lactis subsp. lactis]